jgi:hypothetical protein
VILGNKFYFFFLTTALFLHKVFDQISKIHGVTGVAIVSSTVETFFCCFCCFKLREKNSLPTRFLESHLSGSTSEPFQNKKLECLPLDKLYNLNEAGGSNNNLDQLWIFTPMKHYLL